LARGMNLTPRARRTPPGYVGVMLSPKEVEQLLDRIERGDGKRG
jgi:hypothetical protein